MKRLISHLLNMRYAILAAVAGIFVLSTGAFAQDAAPVIDKADTAWVLMASALVLLMTPGLGLFYAGMVRKKNALATIMQSFILCGIVGVLWIVYGYSVAFGTDHGGIVGSLEWLGLNGIGLAPAREPFAALYGSALPQQAHMTFQGMFAIITPALISGAIAERIRFKAYVIFVIAWFTIVYCPVAHWVWGLDGWLGKLGALDFAGGTVVHIASGVSALCACLVLGKRKNYGREEFKPHNLTMTLIGTGLLWFGWFGFNAGSALGANEIAVNAFVVTNTGAAAAMLSWVIIEWIHRGKPTALGAASGAVAGLVAVTPACGFISATSALIMGFVVSLVCYGAIMLKGKLGYDDSLDVFGVHGVGGTWGAIGTGLFASAAVNSVVAKDAQGLFFGGNPALLIKQLIAIVSVMAFAFIATFIILKVIGLFTPLRSTVDEEDTGLDITEHGEVGYNL